MKRKSKINRDLHEWLHGIAKILDYLHQLWVAEVITLVFVFWLLHTENSAVQGLLQIITIKARWHTLTPTRYSCPWLLIDRVKWLCARLMCWPHQVGVSVCHLAFIIVVQIMAWLSWVSYSIRRSGWKSAGWWCDSCRWTLGFFRVCSW